MPPIPIYSHSPINAAKKADGISPKTAEDTQNTSPSRPPPPTTTTGAQYQNQNIPYPAAQPGAPAVPAPTGSFSSVNYAPPPTRTQPLSAQGGPPPPQPNAFPVPYGAPAPPQATPTGLPPPPKAGESRQQQQQSPPAPAYYPPQMSIPAPPAAASQSAQRGTATTYSFGHAPQPTSSFLPTSTSSAEHPPGYQQNPNTGAAHHLDNYQQRASAAAQEDERQRQSRAPSLADLGVDGVWGSVKGAMAAAGEKIAAAEEEVWKRINKD